MRVFITLIFIIISTQSFSQIKKVILSNLADSTMKVSVNATFEPNAPGTPVTDPIILSEAGEDESKVEIKLDSKVEIGMFLHTVIYDDSGHEIIFKSHRVDKNDVSPFRANVGKPKYESTNSAEIQKLLKFITERKNEYKSEMFRSIDLTTSATTGIGEYLGAVVILDTASQNPGIEAIKMRFSPVQLRIVFQPEFKGRDYNREYNVTKDFAGNITTSVPAAFNANLDYTTADLHKVKLEIKNIGAINLPSGTTTPLDLLDALDESSKESITEAIMEQLSQCSTCVLTQITSVLGHNGVFALKEEYESSGFAVNASSGSVVTASGTYTRSSTGLEKDYIYPQLLTLGFTGEDLTIRFKTTMLTKYRTKRSELARKVNDARTLKEIAERELQEVDEILNFLDPSDEEHANLDQND